MEDGQHFGYFRYEVILHDVRSSGDRQYPDTGFPRLPAHEGELAQAANGGFDLLRHAGGRSRFISRNERTDLLKVPDSAGIPFYSHLGGGISPFRPQVSSHAITRSLWTVFPEREASRCRASST